MHISAVARAKLPAHGWQPDDVKPAPAKTAPVAPRFRLRFLLMLIAAGWALSELYPRLQAAFRLHDVTVAVADYGLCMAGPTGPTLIRDRPSELQLLVRRRLVASGASDKPFQRCAKLAKAITGDAELERLHSLTASEFREYSGRGVALAELGVTAAPLAKLFADAWPFARGGYTQLIKPSLGAYEAAHVPAPPRPVGGRGLPAHSGVYRNVWRDANNFAVAFGSGSDTSVVLTADRGATFHPLGHPQDAVEQHGERCDSSDARRSYRLAPREDGSAMQVLFTLDGNTAAPIVSELGPIAERIIGTACDERSIASLSADRERLHLRACPFGARCAELTLPPALSGAAASAVDLAKLRGTLVLSVAADGVVRVVSSRDEGKTFTPPVVAFDAAEYPELGLAKRPASRLLALGERLILFGVPVKGNDTYPLLVSDDQGVSFRAP
jgi:hypothetical protein